MARELVESFDELLKGVLEHGKALNYAELFEVDEVIGLILSYLILSYLLKGSEL